MLSKLEKASALYWYCADYHTGMGSTLYRILCQVPYVPGSVESEPCSYEAQEWYLLLQDGAMDASELLAEIVNE